MTTTVTGVAHCHLTDRMWKLVEPYIEGALDWAGGEESLEDIRRGIVERDYQLWVILDGCYLQSVFVTQVVNYPQFRALRIKLYGGLMTEELLKLAWDAIAPGARDLGCTKLEAIGRPGWYRMAQKVLPVQRVYSVIMGDL